jgi:hypothetical protein
MSIVRSLTVCSGVTIAKTVVGAVRRTTARSKLVPKLADLAEAIIERQQTGYDEELLWTVPRINRFHMRSLRSGPLQPTLI